MVEILNTDLTVDEFIKEKHITGKVWVCAHLISNGKLGNPEWMYGMDCTVASIPKEVKSKKVRSYFKDCGYHCIVWVNDDALKGSD